MLWEGHLLALGCGCSLQGSGRIFTWWQCAWAQQPGRRLPGPRAVFIQLLQWLLQHPLSSVLLPVLEGAVWAGSATGVVVSGCQVMSSLSVWLLVSPPAPEGREGICLPQTLQEQGIFSVNSLCALHWLKKCPNFYVNALHTLPCSPVAGLGPIAPHFLIYRLFLISLSLCLDPPPQPGHAVGRSIHLGAGTRQQWD